MALCWRKRGLCKVTKLALEDYYILPMRGRYLVVKEQDWEPGELRLNCWDQIYKGILVPEDADRRLVRFTKQPK